MGFSFDAAERLAASHVDLHEAEHLLLSGCPPDIAEAILL